MEIKKNLYPLRFIPEAIVKPWGGSALIKKLGKQFTESDEEGNEKRLTASDRIGESWELADMGFVDSVAENGWLAGNTFSEIMETYIERITGESTYRYYGRQFPVLVKFLDIQGRTSVQINPDDDAAEQRYDTLGKSKFWYVMDATPESRIYLGFEQDITAQELYDKCLDGTIAERLNTIRPQKGDCIFIKPGTVHAAEGGLLIAEIQESSDLTFRLYDWGRENSPATARPMHLEEAFDLIDLGKHDCTLCHKPAGDMAREELLSIPQFTVSKLNVKEPLHLDSGHDNSYTVYICTEGEASFQVESAAEGEGKKMEEYRLKKGQTILIPADMPEFFIVPTERDTVLLEVTDGNREDMDGYIDPDTEPYLEGEDYGGVEDEEDMPS